MSGNTSNCSTARSVTLSHLATPSPPLAELLARPNSKGVLGTLGILNVFVCAQQRKSFDWFRSGRLVGELVLVRRRHPEVQAEIDCVYREHLAKLGKRRRDPAAQDYGL